MGLMAEFEQMLVQHVENVPEPQYDFDSGEFRQADSMVDGFFTDFYEDWYPDLVEHVENYVDGDAPLETVSEHAAEVPVYNKRTEDGKHRVNTASGKLYGEEDPLNDWYKNLGYMLWTLEYGPDHGG